MLVASSLLVCGGTILFGQDQMTGKVFVEASFSVATHGTKIPFTPKEWLGGKWSTNSESITVAGTYWPLTFGDRYFYVTAHHVISPQLLATSSGAVDGTNTKVISRKTRAFLGTLAEPVGEVGSISTLKDVAFLRPKRKQALEVALSPMILSTNTPHVGEAVKLIGYPGTSYQQVESGTVSSVQEDSGFFVLNKPVNSGFSGGPVLDQQNHVYGIVSSGDTNNQQTTIVRLRQKDLDGIQWFNLADLDQVAVEKPDDSNNLSSSAQPEAKEKAAP